MPTRPGSRERRYCTGPYAARVTGLELCGHVELPWSPEALTLYGPAALSMTLHKRDTHTGYSFIAKHVKVGSTLDAAQTTSFILHWCHRSLTTVLPVTVSTPLQSLL